MANDPPTNETVVMMLEQIARELSEVRKQQQAMKARLDEIHTGLSQ